MEIDFSFVLTDIALALTLFLYQPKWIETFLHAKRKSHLPKLMRAIVKCFVRGKRVEKKKQSTLWILECIT